MISNEELWKKCVSGIPITRNDLGITHEDYESRKCPVDSCIDCDGVKCKRKYYMYSGDAFIIYRQ